MKPLTLELVAIRAGITMATVLRDMDKELLSDLSSHGHEWINLFHPTEVELYLKYRSTLTHHRPPPKDPVNRHDRMVAMLASCKRIGAPATAIKFGIKLESLKRNLRNWKG